MRCTQNPCSLEVQHLIQDMLDRVTPEEMEGLRTGRLCCAVHAHGAYHRFLTQDLFQEGMQNRQGVPLA